MPDKQALALLSQVIARNAAKIYRFSNDTLLAHVLTRQGSKPFALTAAKIILSARQYRQGYKRMTEFKKQKTSTHLTIIIDPKVQGFKLARINA